MSSATLPLHDTARTPPAPVRRRGGYRAAAGFGLMVIVIVALAMVAADLLGAMRAYIGAEGL